MVIGGGGGGFAITPKKSKTHFCSKQNIFKKYFIFGVGEAITVGGREGKEGREKGEEVEEGVREEGREGDREGMGGEEREEGR